MTAVNSIIDHTLLKFDSTREQVLKICQEAKEYGFASVCIPPSYVSLAREQLSCTSVKVCTVIGFPLGYNKTSVKIFEAREAVSDGALELDYVVNISDVKNGQYEAVEHEMKAFKSLKVMTNDLVIKVILETCYLTKGEIAEICKLAKLTGLNFVKTSTGFGTAGAIEEDVKLMRQIVGEELGVKASGGIRTYEDALKMIEAGASRLGTSNGVGIVTGKNEKQQYQY